MPGLHAVAAVLLLAAAPAVPASATDGLSPTAQCAFADAYKVVVYGGWAYTTGAESPRRLSLICSIDNGTDTAESRMTSDTRVVAAAFTAVTSVPDSITICTTAVAEYATFTRVTSHCDNLIGES